MGLQDDSTYLISLCSSRQADLCYRFSASLAKNCALYNRFSTSNYFVDFVSNLLYLCLFNLIIMSKLIKTDADYSRWIQELKERYRRSQIKAATQVNREMLRFYWSLGRDIVARHAENIYGSGFFKFFSQDLRHEIPDGKGFSPQNLYYMKNMYLLYSEDSMNYQQIVAILRV